MICFFKKTQLRLRLHRNMLPNLRLHRKLLQHLVVVDIKMLLAAQIATGYLR